MSVFPADAGLPSASMVIPTYNRPADLESCLASILRQSVLPDEVLVIDDGALEEVPLRQSIEAAGIKLIYHKKDEPGLTQSRNKGVELSSGQVVLFLDDDTELLPDYLEQMLGPYARDPEVMGVGALIANLKPMTAPRTLRWCYDLLVLNRGFRAGRVLPSGFCTDFGETPFRIRRIREVDFQDGGAASYRRNVFDEFVFTDGYRAWGLGEDKDFSYQVAKRHKMLINPHARLYHWESPTMRPDRRLWGRKFTLGRFLFFRDHVKTGPWAWVFFWYALAGYVLARVVMAALSPGKNEWRRVAGILGAARDIATGKIAFGKDQPGGSHA